MLKFWVKLVKDNRLVRQHLGDIEDKSTKDMLDDGLKLTVATMRTPGIIGVPGKCPVKYGSFTLTFLRPTADSFGVSSVTFSIIWNGGRCAIFSLIS